MPGIAPGASLSGMKMLKRKVCLLVLVLFAGCLSALGAVQPVPVLKIGGDVYTNAVVIDQEENVILIRSSKGITTVQISDLDITAMQQLGLIPTPEPTPAPAPPALPSGISKMLSATPVPLGPVSEEALNRMPKIARDTFWFLEVAGLIIGPLILILYIPFCRSCSQLCRRAGTPASALIWLPVVKRLELFKVTHISPRWVVAGLFIPFAGLYAWVLCCLRLCELYQVSKRRVFLMAIPVFGWLGVISLARAQQAVPAEGVSERFGMAA